VVTKASDNELLKKEMKRSLKQSMDRVLFISTLGMAWTNNVWSVFKKKRYSYFGIGKQNMKK
jgi:hypothetical protein